MCAEIQSLQNPFRDWNIDSGTTKRDPILIQSLQNPFRDWNTATDYSNFFEQRCQIQSLQNPFRDWNLYTASMGLTLPVDSKPPKPF